MKDDVKRLIDELGDWDKDVRCGAAYALGDIRDKRAVQPLIKALGDENKDVRKNAARALGNIGDKRAVEPLIKVLGDEDKWVRYEAARALGKIGEPAIEPLIKALGDGNKYVRKNAAKALGNTGDKRAVAPLIKALGDGDELVRMNAAWALRNIGKPAVEPLIKALGDGDWNVRYYAAEALGKIGQPAVEPLIKALGDENKDVRKYAARALGKTGWHPATDEQQALYLVALQKWDKAVKLGKPAVEPLIKALGDGDWNVRKNAAEALGNIGEPAVKPLIKALGDGYSDVRKNAAEALGKIGALSNDSSLKALCKIYSEKHRSDVERSTLEQAAKYIVSHRSLIPTLVKRLSSDYSFITEPVLKLVPDARILSPLKRYYESEYSGIFKGREVKKALSSFVSVLVPALEEQYSHWPHLFCDSCLLRPAEKKLKLGWFKTQKYGQCPGCGTSLLVPGITEVIGVIGGEKGNCQSGFSYMVQLLDREDDSIRYADIDRLEIRPVEGINYDAVINKAVLVLCDNSSRPLKYWKNLPVYIQGVDLSQNAQNMLKQNFGMVTVEA